MRGLSYEARAAYDAPFPTERHKAGARHFLQEDVGPELAERLVAWMR